VGAALEEIKRLSGSAFDPRLVELFVQDFSG
jgi:response regulator RpfG family c-di-GMP phosphodiesterase